MKERERPNNKYIPEKKGKDGEVFIITNRVIELMDFTDPMIVRVVFANKRVVLVKRGTEIRFKNRNVKIRNVKM